MLECRWWGVGGLDVTSAAQVPIVLDQQVGRHVLVHSLADNHRGEGESEAEADSEAEAEAEADTKAEAEGDEEVSEDASSDD